VSERTYSIAVDFDGVIHSYTSPWITAEVIPDPPVPGAIDWLNEISKRFKVIIFTIRGKTGAGRDAVKAWLWEHGFEAAGAGSDLVVTAEKPPALIYLDDRAVRFDGTNFPTSEEIRDLVPWNKKTKGDASEACGRLLVGQGGDTWDPTCVLPAGHRGACRPETGR
jgi:hypothetical protein